MEIYTEKCCSYNIDLQAFSYNPISCPVLTMSLFHYNLLQNTIKFRNFMENVFFSYNIFGHVGSQDTFVLIDILQFFRIFFMITISIQIQEMLLLYCENTNNGRFTGNNFVLTIVQFFWLFSVPRHNFLIVKITIFFFL